MTEREKEILNNVKEIILSKFNVNKIILFGSRAKSKSRIGSDFDFAIETSGNRDESVIQKMTNEVDEISGLYKVDIVFLDKVDEEFKQIIIDTGKVIYEKGS